MNDKERRHIRLSWELIEHKVRYYVWAAPVIEDHEYDALEDEYRALCLELGLPATAADMVGADESRAAVRLVLKNLPDKDAIARIRARLGTP